MKLLQRIPLPFFVLLFTPFTFSFDFGATSATAPVPFSSDVRYHLSPALKAFYIGLFSARGVLVRSSSIVLLREHRSLLYQLVNCEDSTTQCILVRLSATPYLRYQKV